MLPTFWIGSIQFQSYPLLLGIIWALSYFISKKLLRTLNITLPKFNILFVLIFLGAWIGAKLTFLLTLEDNLINKVMRSSGFWFGGGFVFYGGAIGGGIVILSYVKLYNKTIKDFAFVAPVLAISHALGRLACFLAGCCYGSHCDLPWAIQMHGGFRHPVQLYESLALAILAVILWRRLITGRSVICFYIVYYSIVRFVLEFYRGDDIRGLYFWNLSTSQFISLFLLLSCIAAISFKPILSGR